ncbi:MAG: hypothetical protein HWN80_12885 [Candidatus Lokiarchaeota archaeon]|nr:hypothetical protein [Candidatus Lokiarchaeota archaeon]
MEERKISDYLNTYFGDILYEKVQSIPNYKLKILLLREEPLKIRAVIFEKRNIYHIIVEESLHKIYHECPSILMNETFEGKVCIHLMKLIFTIKPSSAVKLIDLIEKNGISFIDSSSEEKCKNFLLLAQKSKESGLILDSLYFSLKAGPFINNNNLFKENLSVLIEQNNFLKFFHYLGVFSKRFPPLFLENYNEIFLDGFSKCNHVIKDWKFLDLIQIIAAIDKILEDHIIFLKLYNESFLNQLNSLGFRTSFEENYFFYYFMNKYSNELNFKEQKIIGKFEFENYDVFENHLLTIIFRLLNGFYPIKYINLIEAHLEVLDIPHEKYITKFGRYYQKIKDIDKKFYVRKFGFFKLLIKKNRIHKSKIELKQVNNLIVVAHDPNNLNNHLYLDYLIPHLGFFGEKKNLIKPRDIGLNFYLFKRLFKIDWKKNPSITYFNMKYWGKSANISIKSKQGLPLLRYGVDYTHDVGLEFLNNDDVMIVEWDIAGNLVYGSQVIAYETHILIPDFRNHLFFDLKPFDLCYCKRTPKEVTKEQCKIIEVITKCSFKDAISSVSKGVKFIEGSYPLSFVQKVLKKELNPFKAIQILEKSPKKQYVPHFYQFIYEFKEFLFNTILKEEEYLFNNNEKFVNNNFDMILNLLNLKEAISGIQIPPNMILNLFKTPQITKDELRIQILNLIHKYVRQILKKKEIGSTHVFNLEKMKFTPFSRYYSEILNVRKDEFEQSSISKQKDKTSTSYDVFQIARTYYGAKILKILHSEGKFTINQIIYNKFKKIVQELGMTLNTIN